MGTYGNARLGDGLDLLGNAHTAFELYRVGAPFLHQTTGVDNSLFDRYLVAHEWHVTDDKRILSAAGYGGGVMDHVFHRYRKCIFVAEHNHAQGISDKDRIDSGFVNQLCGGVVVSSQHRDLGALILHLLECGNSILHVPLLSLTLCSSLLYISNALHLEGEARVGAALFRCLYCTRRLVFRNGFGNVLPFGIYKR